MVEERAEVWGSDAKKKSLRSGGVVGVAMRARSWGGALISWIHQGGERLLEGKQRRTRWLRGGPGSQCQHGDD